MTEKDFDSWNQEKKMVDRKVVSKSLFFHSREIWWCNTGLNIGVEVNGKNKNFDRPMLIVKKFNADLIWVLPLVSRGKTNPYYYTLNHETIQSSVVLSQIKAISTKRLLRRLGIISQSDFEQVVFKLKSFF